MKIVFIICGIAALVFGILGKMNFFWPIMSFSLGLVISLVFTAVSEIRAQHRLAVQVKRLLEANNIERAIRLLDNVIIKSENQKDKEIRELKEKLKNVQN